MRDNTLKYLLVLHKLGDSAHSHAARHVDQRFHEQLVGVVGVDVANEAAVDFQDICAQVLQVRE